MAVLSGNIKPITVARVGKARVKQMRIGYTPKDTKSTGDYIWLSVRGPQNLDDVDADTTWTSVRS